MLRMCRDPKTSEEEEYLENLFDTLCTCLMQPKTRTLFFEAEGTVPAEIADLQLQRASHRRACSVGVGCCQLPAGSCILRVRRCGADGHHPEAEAIGAAGRAQGAGLCHDPLRARLRAPHQHGGPEGTLLPWATCVDCGNAWILAGDGDIPTLEGFTFPVRLKTESCWGLSAP